MDSDLYDIVRSSKHRGDYKYYKKDTQLLHRIDGPAVIYEDVLEEWWLMGYKHRLGGPAVIHICSGEEEYWAFGQNFSLEEFLLMEMIYG